MFFIVVFLVVPQVAVAAELFISMEAFLSSWQFPLWDAGFGSGTEDGNLIAFQPIIHPIPPYHGIAMPAPPRLGGFYLWVSVPSCLVPRMVDSSVLKELAPNASFLSLP